MNASGARRLGKYTSVDAEMSSHEDSSMGSDSEDDSIERTVHATICTRNESKNERSRSKSNSPLSQTLSSISMAEPSRKLNLREIHDQKVAEDVEELCPERVERQVGNPFKISLVLFIPIENILVFRKNIETYITGDKH